MISAVKEKGFASFIDELDCEINKYKSILKEKDVFISARVEDVSQLTCERDKLLASLSSSKRVIKENKLKMDALQKTQADMDMCIKELKKQIDDKDEAMREKTSEIDALNLQMSSLTSKFNLDISAMQSEYTHMVTSKDIIISSREEIINDLTEERCRLNLGKRHWKKEKDEVISEIMVAKDNMLDLKENDIALKNQIIADIMVSKDTITQEKDRQIAELKLLLDSTQQTVNDLRLELINQAKEYMENKIKSEEAFNVLILERKAEQNIHNAEIASKEFVIRQLLSEEKKVL